MARTLDAVCIKGGGNLNKPDDNLFLVIVKLSLEVESTKLVNDYNRDHQQGAMGSATMALWYLFAWM